MLERWHEKLHDWEKALETYKQKLEKEPRNVEFVLGQMRCMESLADWEGLYDIARSYWPSVDAQSKSKLARMAATSSWGLKKWTAMEDFVQFIPKETQEGTFYRAVRIDIKFIYRTRKKKEKEKRIRH